MVAADVGRGTGTDESAELMIEGLAVGPEVGPELETIVLKTGRPVLPIKGDRFTTENAFINPIRSRSCSG